MKWPVCVLLISVSLIWTVEGQPAHPRYVNIFNWIFYDILKYSPDRVGDMSILGINPQYESVIGRNYPDPNLTGEQRDNAARGKTYIDIGRFCLRRPNRCLAAVGRHARAGYDIRPDWYFDKIDPTKVKWSSPWGAIRRYLHGRVSAWWLVMLTFVSLATGALALRRARSKEWGQAQIVLVIMGVLQFFEASFGEGENEIVKHLFLFNAITDLLLMFLLSIPAGVLLRWGGHSWRTAEHAGSAGQEAGEPPVI
jgi:hypothetical protein